MASIVFDKDSKSGTIRNAKMHVIWNGKREKVYIPKKHFKDRRFLSTVENCLNDISEYGAKENWPARIISDLQSIKKTSPKLYTKLEKLGIVATEPKLLLKDVAPDYLRYKEGKVNETTLKALKHYLPIIYDEFDDDLKIYNKAQIRLKIDSMQSPRFGTPYSFTTKKLILSHLRSVYDYLISNELLQINPTDNVRFERYVRDKQRDADKVMLDQETVDLHIKWNLNKGRLKVVSLLKILSTFGCRSSEISEIKPANIYNKDIKRSFSKKYDKPALIPMTEDQIEAIKWISDNWPQFWKWTQQTNIRARIAHLLTKYCDGMTANSLRRFVSLKIREEYGSLVESQLLGHTEDVARRVYQINSQEKRNIARRRLNIPK